MKKLIFISLIGATLMVGGVYAASREPGSSSYKQTESVNHDQKRNYDVPGSAGQKKYGPREVGEKESRAETRTNEKTMRSIKQTYDRERNKMRLYRVKKPDREDNFQHGLVEIHDDALPGH